MTGEVPEKHKANGVIMGRFQPFHNGHLEFMKLVMARCDSLTVLIGELHLLGGGIIERGLWTSVRALQHRADGLEFDSNPFSYKERKSMVEGAFENLGIRRSTFEVHELSLRELLRAEGIIYLNNLEETNNISLTKRAILKLMRRDWETIVAKRIDTSDSVKVCGQFVRERMRAGASVVEYVPPASQEVIAAHIARSKAQTRTT
ncbi:MAG: adenylyltransferase/cytidyltransferase family protein [Candidatus Micrarchaeota archaeon]|nr:adenylyltransferase/cytidyltransferase family protein [Candidatus Micrarchaeota archaeon]